MDKKGNQEDIFQGYFERHFLGRILSTIPLNDIPRALFIALISYLLFLWLSIASDRAISLRSFLHLLQLNFSITIFIGTWFGAIALRDVKIWLEHINMHTGINKNDYTGLVAYVLGLLGNWKSLLFALPFILGGLVISIHLNPNPQNGLFPMAGFSMTYVYTIMIEACIFMLSLLGGAGFWIQFVFTLASFRLLRINSIDYELIEYESIKHLHQTILKLCFLMLIILASAMPGVAYIGFYYGGLTRTLIILIGLALPTLMLISSYFFPTYFLNQLLLRASDYKVLQLKKHIKIYEKELLKKTKRINQILTKKNSKEVIRIDLLVEISNYYKGRIKEEKTHRGGPYASSSIIKLFGASLIPVLTFFLQELIRIYLF